MPEILDSRTFQRIQKKAPRNTYDFAKWSDGQVWRLTRGKDFNCTTGSFTSYLYRYAEQIGMKVQTSVRRTASGIHNQITFQFVPRDYKQPFPAMEEFVEEECVTSGDGTSGTSGITHPGKCVVWDALRDRLGLNDPVEGGGGGGSSGNASGFKQPLEFATAAEHTLI